jgi:hypothetical protein
MRILQLKPRTRAWWLLRFQLLGLKEDEEKSKHFDAAIQEMGKKFSFYIFHLIVPSFSTGYCQTVLFFAYLSTLLSHLVELPFVLQLVEFCPLIWSLHLQEFILLG